MLEDIILGMVVRATEDRLYDANARTHLSGDQYKAAIRFLQHYSAMCAYLSTDINCWGPEATC